MVNVLVSISISIKDFIVRVYTRVRRVQCVLQTAAGVGRRLRGLRGIVEDWPDWISVAGAPSPGSAWRCGRQQGSNQTEIKL